MIADFERMDSFIEVIRYYYNNIGKKKANYGSFFV